MKKVVLLGSTGSIGTSTVKVVQDLSDRLELVGLGAGGNVELLSEQIRTLKPLAASIGSEKNAARLRDEFGKSTQIYSGEEA
jgi:1-deoxy-D-xylulose-5-phosphate reductoisomerase